MQNHSFGCHFSAQKKVFYIYFQMWLFNFNAILRTCLKKLFRKTEKIGDFTLLNKSLEPYPSRHLSAQS